MQGCVCLFRHRDRARVVSYSLELAMGIEPTCTSLPRRGLTTRLHQRFPFQLLRRQESNLLPTGLGTGCSADELRGVSLTLAFTSGVEGGSRTHMITEVAAPSLAFGVPRH